MPQLKLKAKGISDLLPRERHCGFDQPCMTGSCNPAEVSEVDESELPKG
jgi:hypothetical protein